MERSEKPNSQPQAQARATKKNRTLENLKGAAPNSFSIFSA